MRKSLTVKFKTSKEELRQIRRCERRRRWGWTWKSSAAKSYFWTTTKIGWNERVNCPRTFAVTEIRSFESPSLTKSIPCTSTRSYQSSPTTYRKRPVFNELRKANLKVRKLRSCQSASSQLPSTQKEKRKSKNNSLTIHSDSSKEIQHVQTSSTIIIIRIRSLATTLQKQHSWEISSKSSRGLEIWREEASWNSEVNWFLAKFMNKSGWK